LNQVILNNEWIIHIINRALFISRLPGLLGGSPAAVLFIFSRFWSAPKEKLSSFRTCTSEPSQNYPRRGPGHAQTQPIHWCLL